MAPFASRPRCGRLCAMVRNAMHLSECQKAGPDCGHGSRDAPSMPNADSCACGRSKVSRLSTVSSRFCFMNPDELRNSCEAPEEVNELPTMPAPARASMHTARQTHETA